jgi:hypothetical protein
MRPNTQLLPPITTSQRHHFANDVVNSAPHRHLLPMCCLQLPHYIASFLRCYRQLPHHISIIYPCAVANSHITSAHITHVLLPINTSHCVLFPSCCHQLLHHIDIISYIMQSITPSHCHLLPMCCRPHNIASYFPGSAANYHITSKSLPRWCS